MPNTIHLLEQVRARTERHTNYAVAKALEMSQSHLDQVLCGKCGLGPKAVVRVSEILQRDLRDVLVLVEEDKAKTPKERAFWERRSPRITAAIAVAILALTSAVRLQSAAAELYNRTASSFPFYTLCEVSKRKFLTFIKDWILRSFVTLLPRLSWTGRASRRAVCHL